MAKFTRIPENTFGNLQLNAGVVASDFNTETGEIEETALLGATTGGVNFSATADWQDLGEGIDNAPRNVKELKKLLRWNVTMGGNFVTINPETTKRLIAAADIDSGNTALIKPRNDVLQEDFKDLWWVGDYSDINTGKKAGYVAIHMLNALNTGGFKLQSTDRDRGQFAFEFTGHYSIEAQDTPPFEVYVKAGEAEAA